MPNNVVIMAFNDANRPISSGPMIRITLSGGNSDWEISSRSNYYYKGAYVQFSAFLQISKTIWKSFKDCNYTVVSEWSHSGESLTLDLNNNSVDLSSS